MSPLVFRGKRGFVDAQTERRVSLKLKTTVASSFRHLTEAEESGFYQLFAAVWRPWNFQVLAFVSKQRNPPRTVSDSTVSDLLSAVLLES